MQNSKCQWQVADFDICSFIIIGTIFISQTAPLASGSLIWLEKQISKYTGMSEKIMLHTCTL